jgi:pimeloyl-ACP methyl ester carboxylesterase
MGNMSFTTTHSIKDGDDTFDVTVLQPGCAVRSVLFAAGRGGNPMRHLGLLQTLASHGALIVAPHFEMLASSIPTEADLTGRGRRLVSAMNSCCSPDLPIIGVGHSIGAVVLLMLAGAAASTFFGNTLTFSADQSFESLVLFSPPTNFFRRPGALAPVKIPMQVWAGGKDTITPPVQARFLKEMLADKAPIDIHIVEDAGHFTFMNELPPNIVDPHPARDAFLQFLGEEVSRYLGS